jgi:hypothetical protein
VYEQKLYHPTYTVQHPGHHDFGMPMHHPYPSMHGFCHSCCHPIVKCCCGMRECRKEAKELMVSPPDSKEKTPGKGTTPPLKEVTPDLGLQQLYMQVKQVNYDEALSLTRYKTQREAFIGGGCCVHLSVEFMPKSLSGTDSGAVNVTVKDSEGTMLRWGKIVEPGSGYQIKESIISTNPGAILYLDASNAIARVRWCECFSC